MMRNQKKKSRSDDSELRKKFEEYKSFIASQRLRAEVLDLKTSVLAGGCVIFQALTYGHLNPSSAWLPACLSASVSAAFWPAFVAAVNDCMETRWKMESCFIEKDDVYRKLCSTSTPQYDEAAARRSLGKAFASERRRRHAYVALLYSALFLVTVCTPIQAAIRCYKTSYLH